MTGESNIKKIRGYCSMCSSLSPTVSVVKDGV